MDAGFVFEIAEDAGLPINKVFMGAHRFALRSHKNQRTPPPPHASHMRCH